MADVCLVRLCHRLTYSICFSPVTQPLYRATVRPTRQYISWQSCRHVTTPQSTGSLSVVIFRSTLVIRPYRVRLTGDRPAFLYRHRWTAVTCPLVGRAGVGIVAIRMSVSLSVRGARAVIPAGRETKRAPEDSGRDQLQTGTCRRYQCTLCSSFMAT